MIRKAAAFLLCALLLNAIGCAAESGGYAPLPFDSMEAPYAPREEGWDDSLMHYQDASITVRAEQVWPGQAAVLLVYITLSDASQFRTAWAGSVPASREVADVREIASACNAVAALNGDYFAYHSEGIVWRNGIEVRMRPVKDRDTLIIDTNGDFHILAPTTKKGFEEYRGSVLHAFCFGPSLVKDGVTETDFDRIDLDCMKYKRDQRLAIGQLDTLSYVIAAVDGPAYASSAGMTLPELAAFMKELGCVNAYNLDGGNSACVVLHGIKMNAMNSSKVREVGDIIYFATLCPDEGTEEEQ